MVDTVPHCPIVIRVVGNVLQTNIVRMLRLRCMVKICVHLKVLIMNFTDEKCNNKRVLDCIKYSTSKWRYRQNNHTNILS